MFENISQLDFGEEGHSLSFNAIISREGENLPLKGPINIKLETVDRWMKKLEDYMKEAIFRSFKDTYKAFDLNEIKQWYLNNKSQAVMTLTQYAWTMNTENALEISDENQTNSKSNGALQNELKMTQQNL